MKKKLCALGILLTLTAAILGGCGAKTVTVTFMDGDTVLGTVETTEGQTLPADSYAAFESADDADFIGWYETPSFIEASKKELATETFSEDATLYGRFEVANTVEDTRKWYIAGTSSKGPLAANSWAGGLSDDEKAEFELAPTGNFNEFVLTIDLYEGDEFQIIPDWQWDGQKGYGLFTEIDETQMKNGGGLSGNDDTSNVDVIADGSYTITLTTYPDNPSQDTLSIVRVGDAAE